MFLRIAFSLLFGMGGFLLHEKSKEIFLASFCIFPSFLASFFLHFSHCIFFEVPICISFCLPASYVGFREFLPLFVPSSSLWLSKETWRRVIWYMAGTGYLWQFLPTSPDKPAVGCLKVSSVIYFIFLLYLKTFCFPAFYSDIEFPRSVENQKEKCYPACMHRIAFTSLLRVTHTDDIPDDMHTATPLDYTYFLMSFQGGQSPITQLEY